mgnify:FL=1
MKPGQIGVRREDKNKWEKRVPIVPDDVRTLVRDHHLDVVIQPALDHRIFPDDAYRSAGARISESLDGCNAVFGVKEIPLDLFAPGVAYIFFSHVIKGQSYNMPMLRKMMQSGCSLIDYEKIEDDHHRRLIFFGRHAGLSGMVETLHSLGQRLLIEGVPNPFSGIRQPYLYQSLDEIKAVIREVGDRIRTDGLPPQLTPFICGFTGYGNVSRGAQEIFDLLGGRELDPADVRGGLPKLDEARHVCHKVVFHERHLVEPVSQQTVFELKDYYEHPEKYRSVFMEYVPNLNVLVNCIYWTTRYPRLITLDDFRGLFSGPKHPTLRVIGDISCDIDGSIEATVKATSVDSPMFVYDPVSGRTTDGFEGPGIVIMSIENLPCEIAREASIDFSRVLTPFVPGISRADFDLPGEQMGLGREIRDAVILKKGALTPPYQYINQFLNV